MSHDFKGLTWDHPRGFDALDAAARLAGSKGLSIHWDKQPLEGFESASISKLAQQYDLLVIDHPHLGDALAEECLQRMDSLFDPTQLAVWKAQSIGNSFASYHYGRVQWALPLDAATQVAAWRPELSSDPAPSTWAETLAYAQHHTICLSLAGPHAFLTWCSLAYAFGARMSDHQDRLFNGGDLPAAWDVLTELYARSPASWRDKNPIAQLHAMSSSDDIVYSPLVYGYVNYSGPASPGQPISFVDAPCGPSGDIGSVLGGTGIAITRRCRSTPALLAHLRHLMSLPAQTTFIPKHRGQPSARQAWQDPDLNHSFRQFYANTSRTLDQAFIRPRFAHYTPFQLAASNAVRELLDARADSTSAQTRLQTLLESAAHQAKRHQDTP